MRLRTFSRAPDGVIVRVHWYRDTLCHAPASSKKKIRRRRELVYW